MLVLAGLIVLAVIPLVSYGTLSPCGILTKQVRMYAREHQEIDREAVNGSVEFIEGLSPIDCVSELVSFGGGAHIAKGEQETLEKRRQTEREFPGIRLR